MIPPSLAACYSRNAGTYGGAEALFEICNLWLEEPVHQVGDSPLYSEIPTLILTGQFDPTTPPTYSQRLAENLPNSHYFVFPGYGHVPSSLADDGCPIQIAKAFLHDPTSAPAEACLEESESISFVSPVIPQRDRGLFFIP